VDELPDIAPFQRKLAELGAQMADPGFYGNLRKVAEVTREQQKVQRLVEDFGEYERVGRELADTAARLGGLRRRGQSSIAW